MKITLLQDWDNLPDYMKTQEVWPYWEILNHKKGQLLIKRLFDLVMSGILLVILAIPMAVIAGMIRRDSDGPVIYRQERVTAYGKRFRIHKFRTMVNNADRIGTLVSVEDDSRITKVGAKLRKHRLDELPQLFDVLLGKMSFVGTRPEVPKYVEQYKPEYYATLLLPAGITSEASIKFKDEDRLLDAATDVDKVYMNQILPQKMEWNLKSIQEFKLSTEIWTMIHTIFAVFEKESV